MNSLPAELWRWDAADLVAATKARKISSREATLACLDRIDQVDS